MLIERTSSFKGVTTSGRLYLVPTPIGNLGDMSPRAVTTLQEVDLIAAEDTRNTAKLLNYFEIKTPQISFHEHNTMERIPLLVDKLLAGQNIAQVSDAGMPSISDPGQELVKACIEKQIPVVPLPGPNAALTALIASGITPQPFTFYGFLPRKNKDLKAELATLANERYTLIFYEAPHRLKKTLKALLEAFGGDRQVVLCRELTKQYEEFLRGDLQAAYDFSSTEEVRGEFVLIVAGNSTPNQAEQVEQDTNLSLKAQVEALVATGLKPNTAIKEVAKRNNLKKQVVYNDYHEID